jgi:hypothetical protein
MMVTTTKNQEPALHCELSMQLEVNNATEYLKKDNE